MNKKELYILIENKIKDYLIETNYNDFKTGTEDSPKIKVNKAISEINSNLLKIERLAKHATKLKNESEISSDGYWNITKGKIAKIQERITRLSNQMKQLGS